MKVGKFKDAGLVTMMLEVTNQEERDLIFYAVENIPFETINHLMIEWAVNDMLKKAITEKMITKTGKLKVPANKRCCKKSIPGICETKKRTRTRSSRV